MSHAVPDSDSRRRLLKLLGGAPILPLAGCSLPGLLAGCGVGAEAADAPPPTYQRARFIGMPAPSLAAPGAMATTSVASRLELSFSDGSRRDYTLAYRPFFHTGDAVPDGRGGTLIAGGYYDIHNRPLIDRSVPGRERQFFSDAPDGTSLLALPGPQIPGAAEHVVFAVVQFEYTTRDQGGQGMYGALPSPIAVLTLEQDRQTGALRLLKYHNVDTSAVHGLWITCGASLSPWGTHLASEEYEPDAPFASLSPQFRAYSRNLFGDESAANPYHYGHLPEVTVHPDGSGSVKKHYCLGRLSHEVVQVMPDERTALMGDDCTNGGLFLFVADRPRDLSAGTLYVAKVGAGFSLDTRAAGAPLRWIRLGHATSAEIEALADRLRPSDIMTVLKTDPGDPGFEKIYCDGAPNWVGLAPGMQKAAAFLETHRYANLVGASMGFTKLEGTTVNVRDKVAYSALQNIQGSMVRGHAAWRESNKLTVDHAVNAGAVLAHDLAGSQTDTDGESMVSDWVPVRTRALLVGQDQPADALGNLADPDKIANPDNLKFSEKLRTLFIGEDSGAHVNNFLWAYQIDTGELSRVMSIPAGGESTGLHAVDEINGWTYVMSNFQHAGDWNALHGVVRDALDPLVRAGYADRYAASVGYLTADGAAVQW